MARQRVPSNVLKLRGADKVHPGRYADRKDDELDLAPFPKSPPAWFTEKQKTAWRAIVKPLPKGILKGTDAIIVEVVAVLYAELRAQRGNLAAPDIAQLRIGLAALGMTPADRSRLAVGSKKTNPFHDL